MEWLPNAMIGAATVSMLVGAIYCYIYYFDRERYLLLWGISWLCYSSRFIIYVLIIRGMVSPQIGPLALLTSLAGAAIFIWGAYLYSGRKINKIWLIAFTACAVWSVLYDPKKSFLLYNLPSDIVIGWAYFWTGVVLLRHEKIRGVGLYVASWSLILWGIHKADFAILRPVEWFAPWGFLLATVLFLSTSMGIILLYYERVRAELNQQILVRRQVEEDLRESQSSYRRIVDTANEGIWTIDGLQRTTFVNKKMADMLGYTPQEIIDKEYADFIYPEDLDAVLPGLAKCWEGQSASFESRYVCKDGSIIWALVNAAPILDEQEACAGSVGMYTDITRRKNAEAERSQLEENLRQAHKMQAIGTLAGGIAHDFNNILSAIIGYTELTIDDLEPDSPLRDNLEQTLKSSKRARNLVAQLLAYSRKQVLEASTFALNDLINSNQSMLSRILGEDIKLEVKLDPVEGYIKADFNQIEQVLINLVANARDAVRSGGRLTIETAGVVLEKDYTTGYSDIKAGSYVLLAVSDDGPGLEDGVLKQIFDPFFTTKQAGKGTGMGLATVLGIITQHGGGVAVNSKPGKGTTFNIYLPITQDEIRSAPEIDEGSELVGGDETVLVVEDEVMVRNVIVEALGRAGYGVIEAQGGPESLEIIGKDNRRVDLLVTDVIMPQMNGKELYDHLSAQDPGLKVLFISGYTDDIIADQGVVDSDVAFLQKPISIATLLKKVRQVLDNEVAPS